MLQALSKGLAGIKSVTASETKTNDRKRSGYYQDTTNYKGEPMKITSQRILSFLCFVGLSCSSYAAIMEEVVVTAQKREQNAQEVGIAINALTGDQMDQLGYTNAQQVTAMAAGVSTVQPNGESNYSIAIRGVANSDFTTNVESPVAVYLDDVYISQMSGTGFMLFDMDRVEILKGPQGTLYGRNATGGLAHFITKKPSDELEGYGRVTLGRFNQFKLEGAVGGPLSDNLKGRVSFASNKHDPYINNRIGKDLNNGDEQSLRLQLLWEPSDNFDALFNYRMMDQNIDTGFFEHVTSLGEPGELTPDLENYILGYIDTDNDIYAGDYDEIGFNDLEIRGYSATMNWDTENFTFTSISDYSTVTREYIEDSDASPAPVFSFYLSTDAEQFSQEFRFTGGNENTNWVAGLYYMDLEVNDGNGGESEPFFDPVSDTPALSGIDNPYTSTSESISVYGQAEYDLSDSLSLVAGLRWISEDKTHSYQNNLVDYIDGSKRHNGNPNVWFQIGTYDGARKDKKIAGRLGLNWDYSDDVLIYMSFNRGVKAGGYNAMIFPPAEYTDEVFSYDPEQLDAIEIGFKSRLSGGLAQINATYYSYDYKNQQVFQLIGIDSYVLNADSEASGGEIELITSPVEGLEIMLGAAYNDVDVDLGFGGPMTTTVNSPKWNQNMLIRYEFDLMGGKLAIQYDAQHRSEHYFSITQFPAVTEDGYTLQNAAVSFTNSSEKWDVRAYVHNLGGEEYLVQTFDLSTEAVIGMTEQYYGHPRWAGLTLTVSF